MSRHTRDSHEQRYAGLRSGLAPSPMYPQQQQQQMPLPTSYYAAMSSAAPASSSAMPMPQQQQQHQASFDAYGTDTSPALPGHSASHRPSSGAWTPQNDQQLIDARMQGLNWAQIRNAYFPSKTPNACRKRHERLMVRKGADDWDTLKMQRIAKEYMSMRKEVWSALAARTGEKWSVVEAKCMSIGLKNLQSAARAASRRDRLETGASLTGYDDDSGISGIALTPVDELDASYSSPEPSPCGAHSFSSGSAASSGYQHHLHPHAAATHHTHHHHHHHHPHQHQGQHQHQSQHQGQGSYGMGAAGYYGGHGYSSSTSSTASISHDYVNRGVPSQAGSPYMDSQRLAGADMGIDAIVNPPRRG